MSEENNNSIIERAEEFFYFEDVLPDKIEEWAKKYCYTFESITQEHPLLHTQFHEEYCILFESIFSEFLKNENITLQQFYSVISEQYTKQNSFAKMLTSAIEFESFIQMMVDVREGCGVVFCPPLISVYDDDIHNDDFKSNGKDYSDYIKGDFDFIETDTKQIKRYNDDNKNSNEEILYNEKYEKNEK